MNIQRVFQKLEVETIRCLKIFIFSNLEINSMGFVHDIEFQLHGLIEYGPSIFFSIGIFLSKWLLLY